MLLNSIASWIVAGALAAFGFCFFGLLLATAFRRVRKAGMAFALIAAGFLVSMASKPTPTPTPDPEPTPVEPVTPDPEPEPTGEAYLSIPLAGEYARGVQIDSVAVKAVGVTATSYKVTGLPTGLKFDAKALTISGKPTKSGVFSVAASALEAKTTVLATNLTVVVRGTDETKVAVAVALVDGSGKVVEADEVPGKVTGAGVYAAGKKVTLKATATKGYVFNGWYAGTTPVSQAASYALIVPDDDVSYTARYVTSAVDKAGIRAYLDGRALTAWVSKGDTRAYATNVWQGVRLAWTVSAEALSATTVKVSGLPGGVKYDAKTGVIAGAPTAASKSGKPSTVLVTVTTAGKSSQKYEIDVTVDALPDWAVGAFTGLSYEDGATNGLATVTVSAAGKITAKHPVDGKATSFTATCFDRYDASTGAFYATLSAKSGKTVVTSGLAVAEGRIAADLFDAWWYNWKVEPGKSEMKALAAELKTLSYDTEDGTVTLKFAASGAVSVTGVFGAVKASCSTTVVEIDGRKCVFVYLAPKGLSPHVRCVEL